MMGITLCNPVEFDDIEKLKQAVLDSNEQVIAAIRTLAVANHNMMELLSTLVMMSEKGNIHGLQHMLADLTFMSKQIQQPTKH